MEGRENKPKKASQRAVESALIWAVLALLFAFSGPRFTEMPGWYTLVMVGVPMIPAAAYYFFDYRKSTPPAAKTAEAAPEQTSRSKHFMDVIDGMEGREFETFCGRLLEELGYTSVHVTKAVGDHGVDIVANDTSGIRCAFQCKRYTGKVDNSAVQQVNTGRDMYSCFRAVVITNSFFTRSAQALARASHVELWDRDILQDKVARVVKTERQLRKMQEETLQEQ